jgi:hypothetical protein
MSSIIDFIVLEGKGLRATEKKQAEHIILDR